MHKYSYRAEYTGTRHEVTTMFPLRYCRFGTCGVDVDALGVHLMSYSTKVCTIDPQGWLSVTGLYSTATRRHIGAFLKEHGKGTVYAVAKACFEQNKRYNINTGEWAPVTPALPEHYTGL